MLSVLMLSLLAADVEASRLLSDEVAAGVGILGTGFNAAGARIGDGTVTPQVSGRAVLRGFVVEGGGYLSAPLSPLGPYLAFTLAARVGWSWTRWAVVAGAVFQYSGGAAPPTQLLPSLRVQGQFSRYFGASLGVLDLLGLVPLHLTLELGPFRFGRLSVGYVAPIGAVLGADLPLARGFGLRAHAFFYRLGNSDFAMLSLSGTLGGTR